MFEMRQNHFVNLEPRCLNAVILNTSRQDPVARVIINVYDR